jgi:8-oxo-dGTP pyrophosphatase MutT (NUDIX family)
MDELPVAHDVAATVIYRGDAILLVYNVQWGAFTLPMTKRRRRTQLGGTADSGLEDWSDAAMRNVGEALGITSPQTPEFLLEDVDVRQSDRTGEWKRYHFQLFALGVDPEMVMPRPGTLWLRAEEILDEARRPISPTARFLVRAAQADAASNQKMFPPTDHYIGGGATLRQSLASVAAITRVEAGETRWLVQWNEGWDGYFLVGGHKRQDETFFGCIVREIGEELGLPDAKDFNVPPEPRCCLQFIGYSDRLRQPTAYMIEVFDVSIDGKAAQARIDDNPANRWVSEDEIRAGRAEDGRTISPTMEKVLTTARLI